jgi:hypothetical protein
MMETEFFHQQKDQGSRNFGPFRKSDIRSSYSTKWTSPVLISVVGLQLKEEQERVGGLDVGTAKSVRKVFVCNGGGICVGNTEYRLEVFWNTSVDLFWRKMLLNLREYIRLLENVSLKNWLQDSGGVSVICGDLKSLWMAASMMIEFIIYSAVE